jgi:Di-haem oxidoreductase, putative peroxidase
MFHGRMAAILALRMGLGFGGAPGGEFGGPIGGVSPDELQRFNDGRTAFEEVEDAGDGLGPVFNGTSCAGCHNVGATGGGSEVLETRFGTVTDGAFDPLVERGGSLIQTDGIGAQGACVFVGETVPAEATAVARRRATPLFGLGLVDAVPDATFVTLARQQARRRPETAGRPSMVVDVTTGAVAVGKFGWKGQVASLRQFSADAYVNEMGITTPLAPDESCPQGDCALLACDPVPRGRRRPRGRRAVQGLHAAARTAAGGGRRTRRRPAHPAAAVGHP